MNQSDLHVYHDENMITGPSPIKKYNALVGWMGGIKCTCHKLAKKWVDVGEPGLAVGRAWKHTDQSGGWGFVCKGGVCVAI